MRSGSQGGDNGQFFRGGQPQALPSPCAVEKHRIWLQIRNFDTGTDPHQFKQTLVGYTELATTSSTLDRNYDAEVFTDNPSINLFSLSPGSTPLTIQGRALTTPFNKTDVVPLGYTCPASTSLEIRSSEFDGLFGTQKFYLRENMGGTPTAYNYYDIANTPHNFTSAAYPDNAPNTTRFQLVFENPYITQISTLCNDSIARLAPGSGANITANSIGGAQMYRYRIRNLRTGNLAIFDRALNWFCMSMVNNTHIVEGTVPYFPTYDTTYEIEVCIRKNDVWQPYGPMCTVYVGPMQPRPSNNNCGDVIPLANQISFLTPTGSGEGNSFDGYRWEITKTSSTPPVTHPFYTYAPFNFNAMPYAPSGFVQAGATYEIKVALAYDQANEIYGHFGPSCIVTTASPRGLAPQALSDPIFTVHPNPYSEQFSIQSPKDLSGKVTLSIYNMLGKLMERTTIDAEVLSDFRFGENFTPGVYNVIVSYSDKRQSLRVIKR